MTFTLKQIRYAVAVARTGHFGRAAAMCSVSQPALSQQVLALEERCGASLFDRTNAGISLTPFGTEFIARAEKVLDAAEMLDTFALRSRGAPERPIRFGLIPTVAPYLLPHIFPELTRRLPHLQFAVSESRTEALLASIVQGGLDIALVATDPPRDGPQLVTTPLFDDPFVLATPRDEARQAPVSLTSLDPERILLLDEGHCFRDQTIAACRLDGSRQAHPFAATSLSTIVEFVANGQGVTLLPSISLRKEASDPRIAIHRLDAPSGRQLKLVWRQATPFADTFHRIADTIRDQSPLPANQAAGRP